MKKSEPKPAKPSPASRPSAERGQEPDRIEESRRGARRSRRFQWSVAALAAVAFAIRFAYIWQIRSSPFWDTLLGDARGYDAWARQIAAGDWVGQGVFYQAPLYPYFLGVIYSTFGRDLFVVRICQAIIGAAACALVALAGRRLHSESVGLVAGLGLAIYAPSIFFDGLLQKSVLDLFFLSLVLWLFSGILDDPAKRSRWFFLGFALGTLALTRENALLLVVPILLWRFWYSAAPSRAHAVRSSGLAFVLGLLVVLSPVAVRNRVVGGEWHLTTSQFGSNFYLGNNSTADGTAVSLREGRGSVEYERQDATNLAEAAVGRALTPREVSNYWTRQALAFIRANPRQWMELEAKKLMLMTNSSELIDTESQESYAEWSPILRAAGHVAHFGVLLPIAVLGAIVGWPERRRWWPLYGMAGAYAASLLVFYVSARYRLPLVPFLMLFAAVGLSRLPTFLRSARRITVAATVMVLTAVGVLANRPIWPPGLMQAVTDNNLANVLQSEKNVQEAERHYRRAIDIRSDYAPAYINLGELLLVQNRLEEAIEVFRRASGIAPADADLNTRLGIAFVRAGRSAEAVSSFRHALAAGEHSADLYTNLTASLVDDGRDEEAVAVFGEALQRHPSDSGLRFRFGTLLLQRGNFGGAVEQFRAGLAVSPQTPEAHGNLGAALAASGRTEEAILEFEEALRLKPDLVSARRNLEIVRQELKKKR